MPGSILCCCEHLSIKLLFFFAFVCVFVGDIDGDRDSRVEAVDKISALYFWQSHLAVDEEKRGGEDREERVIVMELSEVWECWMKWGPEEQWETKVGRERGGWLPYDLAVEENEGWRRRILFLVFLLHHELSKITEHVLYLCFGSTEFEAFLCHQFACI